MAFLFKLEQTDFKKKIFTKYFHVFFSMGVELLVYVYVYVFIHEHTCTYIHVPFSSVEDGVGIPGATTCTFQILYPVDYVVH